MSVWGILLWISYLLKTTDLFCWPISASVIPISWMSPQTTYRIGSLLFASAKFKYSKLALTVASARLAGVFSSQLSETFSGTFPSKSETYHILAVLTATVSSSSEKITSKYAYNYLVSVFQYYTPSLSSMCFTINHLRPALCHNHPPLE